MSRKSNGYYVMTYGGGRYTSVAWYADEGAAQAEVDRIKTKGAWSGMPPRIESDSNE